MKLENYKEKIKKDRMDLIKGIEKKKKELELMQEELDIVEFIQKKLNRYEDKT